MKYVKNVGIPVGFLLFYVLSGAILKSVCQGLDVVSVTVICDAVVMLLGLWYMSFWFREEPRPYDVRVVFIITGVTFPIWLCVQLMVSYLIQAFPDTNVNNYTAAMNINPYLYTALTLFLAPVTEEVLMRGIFFRHMKKIVPVYWAYFIQAVVFGLLHGTLPHLYLGTILGVLFALIYEYSGKLRYAVVLHMLCNLFSMLGGELPLPDIIFYPACFMPANLVAILIIAGGCVWVKSDQRAQARYEAQLRAAAEACGDELSRRVIPGDDAIDRKDGVSV